MSVFGYDDAPEGHYEVKYENVRVPVSNLVLGWGRGFEIIQGRLGPGRLHHCMRSLGLASRSLDLALLRATDERKKTFGKSLFQHGKVVSDLAESRIEIDQSRLLVLAAALVVDKHPERAKGALREIGMAKVSSNLILLESLDVQSSGHRMSIYTANADAFGFASSTEPTYRRSFRRRSSASSTGQCSSTAPRVSAVRPYRIKRFLNKDRTLTFL